MLFTYVFIGFIDMDAKKGVEKEIKRERKLQAELKEAKIKIRLLEGKVAVSEAQVEILKESPEESDTEMAHIRGVLTIRPKFL